MKQIMQVMADRIMISITEFLVAIGALWGFGGMFIYLSWRVLVNLGKKWDGYGKYEPKI